MHGFYIGYAHGADHRLNVPFVAFLIIPYRVRSKIADDVFTNTGFKEAAAKGYYGDDYDQHMIDKKVKEIQNNYDNKQKVMDKFNGDQDLAKKFMNDTVPEYAQYGITDMRYLYKNDIRFLNQFDKMDRDN